MSMIVALVGIATLSMTNGANLAFSGRNLPAMDVFNGAPDAYVKIFYAPTSSDQYQPIGDTKYILDNKNPDWPEVYNVPNNGGFTQMLKIDMYDSDSPDSDDYMGSVELTYLEVIRDHDGLVTKDLIGGEPGGGQLIIKRQ